VDLEEHAKQHCTCAPRAKRYAFRVDKERVVVERPTITGKEILARHIHARSDRAKRPFCVVSCASVPRWSESPNGSPYIGMSSQ
jgi:transcriptional regulator of aromatic amino acid metabolism